MCNSSFPSLLSIELGANARIVTKLCVCSLPHFYLRRQPSGLREIRVVVLLLLVLVVVLVVGKHYFSKRS